MTGRVLLYGAAGFSGRLVADSLAALGIDLVLAGRDQAKLAPLAGRLALPVRIFSLETPQAIDDALADIGIVLHAAGPFQVTGAPMMAACARRGAHYLDLTGEWPVFADAMTRSVAANLAGIMLMPGIGFSIVASDCLAALAAERAPDTQVLRLAMSQPEIVSRGAIRSILSLMRPEVVIRRDGALATVPVGTLTRSIDFGNGLRPTVAATWPDVVTGQFTTGIGNIETYCEADWSIRLAYQTGAFTAPLMKSAAGRAMLSGIGDSWAEGPSEAERADAGFVLVAEAVDRWRRTTSFRLRTRDGYTVTTRAATEIVRRVLSGDWQPGFWTPAALYGSSFILGLGCAELEDIEDRTYPALIR